MNHENISTALSQLYNELFKRDFSKENIVFGSAALVLKKKYPEAGDIDIMTTKDGFDYAFGVLKTKGVPVKLGMIITRESVNFDAYMRFEYKNNRFDIFDGRHAYKILSCGDKKETLLIHGVPINIRPPKMINEDLHYVLAELDAESSETEGIISKRRKIRNVIGYLKKQC